MSRVKQRVWRVENGEGRSYVLQPGVQLQLYGQRGRETGVQRQTWRVCKAGEQVLLTCIAAYEVGLWFQGPNAKGAALCPSRHGGDHYYWVHARLNWLGPNDYQYTCIMTWGTNSYWKCICI